MQFNRCCKITVVVFDHHHLNHAYLCILSENFNTITTFFSYPPLKRLSGHIPVGLKIKEREMPQDVFFFSQPCACLLLHALKLNVREKAVQLMVGYRFMKTTQQFCRLYKTIISLRLTIGAKVEIAVDREYLS